MTVMTPSGRGLGRVPDLPDIRDHAFMLMRPVVTPLPPVVDFRQSFPAPPGDQGALGSCTAWASLAAFRLQNHFQYQSDFDASELAQYYWTRTLSHNEEFDSGASIRQAIKAVAHFGVTDEKLWPYAPERFTQAPPQEAVQDASHHQAISYQRVLQNIIQLRRALTAGYGVVCGISVYESFESDEATATGNIPLPSQSEDLLGGHAIVLCGYDHDARLFTFRNSWGTEWGNGGYGTLPYAYVISQLTSDFWVIQMIEQPEMG